jgi:adenosine deaminase
MKTGCMPGFKQVSTILLFMFLILPLASARGGEITESEKIISSYFESIRDKPILLRQFLLEMPKGGDLHHHVGGSVYAETLIDLAVKKGLYINRSTGVLVEPPEPGSGVDADAVVPVARAYEDDTLYERIVFAWSLYNFHPIEETANNHFFSIGSRLKMNFTEEDIGHLLSLQRRRAAAENLLYIEATAWLQQEYKQAVQKLAQTLAEQTGISDERDFLNYREKLVKQPVFKKAMTDGLEKLQKVMTHSDRQLTNEPGREVEVRFQYYIVRTASKPDVLTDIIMAFEAAKNSPLVVGINIVAPENNHTARNDYVVHMKMIAAIGSQYPGIKRSLHAGELVLGQAVPEALRFHIRDAVNVAGADRIGHGTDIAYEIDALETVKKMKDKKIAVEILLTSNEMLLGVKGNDHPFPYYVEAGVPVVLAGDDPGIMRTSQTQEFYLAATRYPLITYLDLKGFALNSIRYSFPDNRTKERLLEVLNKRFQAFEERWRAKALHSID